jgi:hypothetical protein
MSGSTKTIAVGLIYFCSALALGDEVFHSDKYDYSMTVPAGWVRIPDDVVREMIGAVVREESRVSVNFDAAFQMADSWTWFSYPYVAVQIIPYSVGGLGRPPCEDEFDELVSAAARIDSKRIVQKAATEEAQDLARTVDFGSIKVDREQRKYVRTMELQVPPYGRIHGEAVGHFGREVIVQVMFYAPADEWDQHSTAREVFVDSISFEPDMTYSAELAESLRSQARRSRVIRGAATGGVMGGIGGLIAAAIARRRKSRRSEQSSTE